MGVLRESWEAKFRVQALVAPLCTETPPLEKIGLSYLSLYFILIIYGLKSVNPYGIYCSSTCQVWIWLVLALTILK